MPPWMVKKIAGVPVWGWGIAALGAIALGLYFRRRAAAAASSSSSGPTGMDDLANSLAGGAPEGAPAGLDPSLAELLANAQNALIQQGQAASDAAMGGPYGYYDPGTGYYDPGDGATDTSGQDTSPSVNVPASGAGTTWSPGAGYTGGGFLTLAQVREGSQITPYAGVTASRPGSNVGGVSAPNSGINISGSYAGGYVSTAPAPAVFTPLNSSAIRTTGMA